MRKDAKIGFAIGGVLLAVLTVYAIVVPKHNRTIQSAGGVTLVTPPATVGQPPAPAANNELPPAVVGALNGDKPIETKPETIAASDAGKSSDGVNWAKLLSGSSDAPALMSTTPSPADDATPAPAKDAQVAKAAPTPSADAAADPASDTMPLLAKGKTSTPATQPVTTGRTYTIKPGQTLSSIAAEVYGNQRFYVAILRANPSVNPARLRPGMKVTLPDISDVQPKADAPVLAATAKETMPKESATERQTDASGHTYKVESGDNLYRIARKLYGSAKMAETIYDLNKEVIGPDKTRLKLGMVLHLPQSPTADGATASTR
jgi:nucleoid-associated protein YgaU